MSKELSPAVKSLMEIADKILEANEGVFLSGSLALIKQGIKVRREPEDIDIYLPVPHAKIKTIEGMVPIPVNDEYDDELYERTAYMVNRTKVDVFTPINSGIAKLQTDDDTLVYVSDILKMKIDHFLSDGKSGYKHREDLLYILVNQKS